MRIFPFLKYSGNKSICFYCLIFVLCSVVSHAQSDKKYLKFAKQAFEQAAYTQAVNNFKGIEALHKQDLDDLLIYFDCLVKIKKLDEAYQLSEFLEIKSKGKFPKNYYLLKGELDHLNGSFDSAIENYKQFIRLADEDDPLREIAKAKLLSCSYARRNNTWAIGVGVLPFEGAVNSIGNEIKPLFSKNLNGVFYYGSASEKSIGGLRNIEGEADQYIGQFKVDMLKATRQQDGGFSTTPLSYLLNTTAHDILAGFSEDGQVLFFGKGDTYDNLRIYADTFEQDISKRKLKAEPYSGFRGVYTRYGLPFLYSDKVILFASDQLGGLGGFDLFVSYQMNGKWSEPENLGPAINTAYNEVSPFLAKNGKVLYFSSDNPNVSHGGYDVFRVLFKTHDFSWSDVQNVGKPVNSYGDDLDFSLSNNGASALLSSDRPGGKGGFDLYNILFEDQREEQLAPLSALVFGNSFARIENNPDGSGDLGVLKPLYYGNDLDLISSENEDYLIQLAEKLRADRTLKLILEVHSNDQNQNQTNAYLAYKVGLRVKQILENYGVFEEQIRLRSFCSFYPLAKAWDEGKETYYGQRVNNRIDIHLWSMDDDYVLEGYQWPNLDSVSRDPAFDGLAEMLTGMSYAVEVFESRENIQDPILYRYKPMIINSSTSRGAISYQLGLFKNIGQAKTLYNSLHVLGYENLRITVFFNGYELEGEELELFKVRFPRISWP